MPTVVPMSDRNAGEAPDKQREEVLDSARRANRDGPRNFNDDALEDKEVRVEPDGTGPTSTGTFDLPEDQRRGSGNPEPASSGKPGSGERVDRR